MTEQRDILNDPECGRCGNMVKVSGGCEFNEGDMCYDCEITRLREQLAYEKIVTEQVQLDYQGAIDERDTLREQLRIAEDERDAAISTMQDATQLVVQRGEQLRIARKGLRWIEANYMPYEVGKKATDTLAQMEQGAGND